MKLSSRLYHNITNLKWRYKIVLLFVLFFCFAGYFHSLLNIDKGSKTFIRTRVADLLGKDVNSVTDEDYAKFTEIEIGYRNYYDLTLLKKFTNLQKLELFDERIIVPREKAIPKWKALLAKLGIIDLSSPSEGYLDLKPVGKLANLTELKITGELISNIKPLKNLSNLKKLTIRSTMVKDLKPLTGLKNLQELYVGGTSISSLEPVKDLTNLHIIFVGHTQISDLKPLKGLTNLKILNIKNCEKISDKQINKLQKALPNLEIKR